MGGNKPKQKEVSQTPNIIYFCFFNQNIHSGIVHQVQNEA